MSELINPNALKLCEALESGRFKKVIGCLENAEGDCCLGVACRVAMENGVALEVTRDESQGTTVFNGTDVDLPQPVVDWLGFTNASGGFDTTNTLMLLNDTQKLSFAAIAAVIRSSPPGLFATTIG